MAKIILLNMRIKRTKILSNTILFSKSRIVCCLLFAITIQSLTPGVVLCFENDGHIEVEFESNRKCCKAFNEPFQKSFTFIFSEQRFNNSGDICEDIPLYITAEKKHNTEQELLNAFVSALNALSSSFYDTHIEKSFPTASFNFLIPINISPITSLQTVILQV